MMLDGLKSLSQRASCGMKLAPRAQSLARRSLARALARMAHHVRAICRAPQDIARHWLGAGA